MREWSKGGRERVSEGRREGMREVAVEGTAGRLFWWLLAAKEDLKEASGPADLIRPAAPVFVLPLGDVFSCVLSD